MDGQTILGIALIITQTGWGIAAWKASQRTEKKLAEHEAKDEANFAELKKTLKLQTA